MTKTARAWFKETKLLAAEWAALNSWVMPEKKVKVIVNIWFYFQNDVRPDCSNIEKALLDALEGVIYINDKYVLAREQDYFFDKKNPRLELNFEVVGG